MAPGHSLLIPKGNYVTVDEMPEDEAANFLKEIPRLTRIVKVNHHRERWGWGRGEV